MNKRKGFIGVFDSGFGGLTILREIVKELPEYQYIYLGDTARTPYGSRSQEVIYEFTRQAIDFLFAKNCDLVILACNSASSEALRTLQQSYIPKYYPEKKVLGVLIPAAEESVSKTKSNKIGVIATESTVHSQAFVREITKISPKAKVYQKAAPLLVPLIEAGEYNSPATDIILTQYLDPLKRKSIDTLILGCTHYSILEAKIKKILGNNISVLSEGRVVAKSLKRYLERHPEVEAKLQKNKSIDFFTTDVTEKFTVRGSKFFGKKIIAKKAIL